MPRSLKMRGVKTIHFKQQCIYCRAVGMYENPRGRVVIFFRHNMPSPGWNRVKRSDKFGGPIFPLAPSSSYGPVW